MNNIIPFPDKRQRKLLLDKATNKVTVTPPLPTQTKLGTINKLIANLKKLNCGEDK